MLYGLVSTPQIFVNTILSRFNCPQLSQALCLGLLIFVHLLLVAGFNPNNMGKAVLLQQALLEAGALPMRIAAVMKGSLVHLGMTLEHMLIMMAIALKST